MLNVKMMLSRSSRCLLSSLAVRLNNFMPLFHSREAHVERKTASNPQVDDASVLFHEMLHSRPLPSVVSSTQILGQLVKLKHYSAAIPLFKQMLLSGIAPNHYTLTSSFFTKMLQAGHCQPDVSTFNTLIKGFCMMRNNSAAMQLLRKMEENGCKPNIVSYSTIIDCLCKDTLVVDAMNLFAEMISRGITPDVVPYTSLIQGLCNIGHWKQATRLLNEILSKRIFPDVITFNIFPE